MIMLSSRFTVSTAAPFPRMASIRMEFSMPADNEDNLVDVSLGDAVEDVPKNRLACEANHRLRLYMGQGIEPGPLPSSRNEDSHTPSIS